MVNYSYLLVLKLLFLSISAEDTLELKMVNLLYRHGDRSQITTFPNDKNIKYWKQGLGQLTERGMRQEFEMGTFLKERYSGKLLNKTYLRKQVYCRSSDKDRTLMSAEAQMAGLYPPKYEESLPKNKDWQFWQLVPIHTVSFNLDNLLVPHSANCPKYLELRKVPNLKYEKMEQEYKEFLHNVSIAAGFTKPQRLSSIWQLNDVFFCQLSHNLSLPSWVTTDVLNTLHKLASFDMAWGFNTRERQRFTGGPLVGEMIGNIQTFIKDPEKSKKLFVYSAHDSTLVSLLSALGIFNGLLPPYSSLLLMELHQNTNTKEYLVRTFYRNDTKRNVPYELSLPTCGTSACTLKEFISATSDVIPTDYEAECNQNNKIICSQCEGCNQQKTCNGLIAVLVVVILLIFLAFVGFLARRYQSKRKGRFSQNNEFRPITEDMSYDSD